MDRQENIFNFDLVDFIADDTEDIAEIDRVEKEVYTPEGS